MFTLGQEVTVEHDARRYDAISVYGRIGINKDAIGIVKRVNRETLHVRFPNGSLLYTGYGTDSGYMTLIVPIYSVSPADHNAPRPRKLGEMPKEGDHIPADDPRIMWLWDDIATYADRKSWCNTFDVLTNELSIPGRKRDVTLTLIVGDGIEAKTTVKARSPKEARDILTAQGLIVKN